MSERDLPLLLTDIKPAISSILEYTTGYTAENNNLNPLNGHISNFVVAGEVLNAFQVGFGGYYDLIHLGRDRTLINPSTFLHPMEGHKIDSVLDAW